MSTLLSRITSLVKALRVANTAGFTSMLTAINGAIDASVIAHRYTTTPEAASPTTVHEAMELGTTTQTIYTDITIPDVPRVLTVSGNYAGMIGNVTVVGTDISGAPISEAIALSGATEVSGTKAFKAVTRIALPIETHAHAKQVETLTIVGLIATAGNAAVTVTAAGLSGSPLTINVPVLVGDDAAEVAVKARAALNANAAVSDMFTAGGSYADVTLTNNITMANDATLNIAIADGTCVGLDTIATSANTTAGVPTDTVSVGVGSAFGMPDVIANPACMLVSLLGGEVDAGTLSTSATLSLNVFTPAGAPDGIKIMDLYYLS